jgi:UPF0716 protein FxsA
VPLLLVVLLVVVPLVEVYVLVQVGQAIGALPTIAILVAMSLLGAYLLRREGSRTWKAFRGAIGTGRVPTREVVDGGLVIFGGALLLTPGFATDLFGLLCILPPTRVALRRVLLGVLRRRLGLAGMVAQFGGDVLGRRTGRPGGSDRVVPGEVVHGSDADGPGDHPR